MPGGKVHELPADLRKALVANTKALDAWKDITPLARNEFICWVEDAKQETDATTSHSPDARGTGGRPEAALLLARLQAPRAHRQIASGARPRDTEHLLLAPGKGPGGARATRDSEMRVADRPGRRGSVSQAPGRSWTRLRIPPSPVMIPWRLPGTLSRRSPNPKRTHGRRLTECRTGAASAMAQRCSRVHQMTLSSLTVLHASQPRARLASPVLKP